MFNLINALYLTSTEIIAKIKKLNVIGWFNRKDNLNIILDNGSVYNEDVVR